MKDMIKRVTKKEGGFTLVELIVVLVILALLAAILVPTLLGYIDKARDEKNYQTAQTVRVAAQSVADSAYAAGTTSGSISLDSTTQQGTKTSVAELAGVDSSHVTACSFTYTNGLITEGTVTIDGSTYTLSSDGSWEASK